jgi:FAD/FMN-containing dehydrogenase
MQRTDAVARKIEQVLLNTDGVLSFNATIGFSFYNRVTAGNYALFFVGLKPWDQRTRPELSARAIVDHVNAEIRRVAPEATAFAGREASYNATFIGFWQNPDDDERRVATARAYSAALAPWALAGGYLNYASETAGKTLETEFGAARFARLRAVKRELDPTNTFRFNHNVPPA